MNPIDLTSLVDVYYDHLAETVGTREIVGGRTWRGSRIGDCLKAQYLEFVEKRPVPQKDARTHRIFEVGHLTGRLIEEVFRSLGVLRETELELDDEELDVGAHVDFIIGGPQPVGWKDPDWEFQVDLREKLEQKFGKDLPTIGVELKSKNSKSFWWAKKENGPVASQNNFLQAALYSILASRKGLKIDYWSVLTVSKDDLTLAEDRVTRDHEEAVLERLGALNWAKDNQDPTYLPCSCFDPNYWNGKGHRYCVFWDGQHCC